VLLYNDGDKASVDNGNDGKSILDKGSNCVLLMMAEIDYALMIVVMDCTLIFGDKDQYSRDRQLTGGLRKQLKLNWLGEHGHMIC